ncbi:MAG: acyltransferase family protein [Frankia sp.]
MSDVRAHAPTVRSQFDGRDNSLNFLRLACAVVVLFVHAWALGGYGVIHFARYDPGTLAVDGFFVISGTLITRSWCRLNSPVAFIWHRFLRIMPAFWMSLLLVAGVCAPIAWLHDNNSLRGYLSATPHGPVQYVTDNIVPKMHFYDIAGTPRGVPFPPAGSLIPSGWDDSLWTLYWELVAYFGVLVLGLTRVIPRRRWLVLLATVASWMVLLLHTIHPAFGGVLLNNQTIPTALRFGLLFLSGAVLSLYDDRIRLSARGAVAAAAGVFGAFFLSQPLLLIVPCFAYLMLWLGVHLPCARIGARNDLSYGVYIYAFPIQQLFAVYGFYRYGFTAYFLATGAVAFAAAFISWNLVERPALMLKDGRRRRPAPVPISGRDAVPLAGIPAQAPAPAVESETVESSALGVRATPAPITSRTHDDPQ